MRDLNHISHDAVALYIKGLEAKGYSKQEIAAKLRNIDRFMQWAYDKDHLHYSRYQQLKDEIAKYSQIFASSAGFSPAEDQSRAVSSTWASPINGRAPPTESTKDRHNGHIVDVKPEGQHTIRQNGDNYGIQESLIHVFVSIPLLNKLPFVQKTIKKADIPVLGPTSAWPQEEERHEDETSTSLLSYIQQRPAFVIGGFMTLLVLSLLSYGIYDRFFQTTETTQAYPATPTFTSTRILSFQGRLTDNLGNPITTSTNMRFRLYDADTAGTTLYDSGTCAITPDQDGVHNVLIGSDCGSAIDSSIFTENTEVWLGVTVGTDSEMTPRQQVANVPYALNAETLQGLPPGTSASSVAYINQGGDLLIGAASPQIGSTYASQTFVVSSANALTLQSASTGDITLLASGSGQLVMQASGDTDDYIYLATDSNNAQLLFEGYTANDPGVRLNSATNQLEYRDENESSWTAFDASGVTYWQLNSNVLAPGGDATVTDKLVLGGNTSTNHQFDVSGAITGKALVLFDETGNQNILTASSSGTTRLNLTNAGQVELKADGSTAGITIGAGDDIALYHDGTDSILTTSTGDWNITAADDFIFTDNQVTNIQLSDVDSSLPNSNTGIVDAINDAWDAATGGGSGTWTDGGDHLYPTSGEYLGDDTSGGSNKIAGLYLLDSAPFVFGTDNDVTFSFGSGVLTSTIGNNDINIDSNTLFIDGSEDKVGIGTATVYADLDIGGLLASPLSVTNPKVLISDNQNAIAGIEMRNTNTGTNADFRFSISDTDSSYLSFAMPGVNNTNTLFGQTRGNIATIFTNSQAGSDRDFMIGTVTNNFLGFGTQNSERMRIQGDGNIVIGDTSAAALLDVGGGTATSIDGTNDLLVADDIEIDGDVYVEGNTTLGNASGDTLTANAATWTFANDTSVVLSGGVDGLNFDSNTLSIDAANDRIGIGSAAPDAAWVDIAAATAAKAQLNLTTSAGTDVSSPTNGDLWWNGTELYFYNGSTNTNLLSTGGGGAWSDLTDPASDLSLDMAEYRTGLSWNTAATSAARDFFELDIINDATTDGGTQNLLALTNSNDGGSSTGATESLLYIDNQDSNEAVAAAINIVDTGGGGFTADINLQNGETIDNATDGTITMTGAIAVTGTSDLQGDVANSTGNLVLADTVDIGSASTGINITTAGAISDSDGNVTINDTVDVTGDITATGDLAVNGDDITSDGNLTLNATGYVRVGDTASPGSANGDDDLFVEGDIELDGVLYLDGTLDTTFTAGSIVFAGASGVLAEDNTNFFWDDTNNKLGIGDNTPDGKLEVSGAITGKALSIFNETGDQAILTASASGTERFTVENNGNVTFNPSAFGSAVTLYDVDTTLPNSNTGIIDAINDAYNAATGSGGVWTDGGSYVYTTNGEVLNLGGLTGVGYHAISDSGTTSNGLASDDDLYIEGNLETDSIIYADAGIQWSVTGNQILNNSNSLRVNGQNSIQFYTGAGGGATQRANISSTGLNILTGYNIDVAGGEITLTEDNAANTPLTITGAASQTGNLTTWEADGGTDLTWLDESGNLRIGTSAADNGKINVTGADTGKALAIFNETGDQDILVASASGTTRFRIANDGAIYGGYWVDISNNAYGLDPAGTTNFGNNSLRITGGALLAEDSGQVGINTSTTNASLDVGGGTANFIDGTDDILVADDVEIDGDLYVAGGIDTAFTQGSVVFAGASGLLTEDNAGFFWDDSANELGIGTNSPGAELHIAGTTPTILVGDGGAEDTGLVFDGNAQDYYIGLDDGTDDLVLGLGSTVGSSPLLQISDTGRMAISNTPGGAWLYLSESVDTDTYASPYLHYSQQTVTGAAGAGSNIYGDGTFVTNSMSAGANFYLNQSSFTNNSTAFANAAYGYWSYNANSAVTSGGNIYNFRGDVVNASTGTTSIANPFLAQISNSSTGTITNAYGIQVASFSNPSGTIGTARGVYIASQTAATNNYGIWGDAGDWVLDEDGNGTAGGNSGGGDIFLGEGQDLELYHDGTDSNIINNTGDLILSSTTGGQIEIASGTTLNIGGITDVAYNAISDSGTTSNGLASDDDLYVEGDFEVDGTLYADGNATVTGDLGVNGGDLTSSAATFNLLNATPTTINFGGAATTVEIGATTGTTSINNALTVDGNTTLGNASGDTVTSNAASWTFANATNVALATSSTALTFATDLLGLDTSNDGIDVTSAGTTTDIFDITANSLTTGTALDIDFNALTSGTGLSLASTSTALTSGSLASLDWSPGSSTTATGDLFTINIGANGDVDSLLNITDAGSSLFKVTESGIESSVPASFTSAGDVSFAYDAIFTNQTSSQIESYGPFSIIAGEAAESNDLTFTTYNSGDIVLDAGGSTSNTGTISFYDSNIKGATVTTPIAFADSSTDINTFRSNFTNENIIDAINETYTAATSGSSPWTDGGGYVYTTSGEVLNMGGLTGVLYHAFSDSGTTSHSLTGDDSLYVEGNFEVDTNAFFDGNITLGDAASDTVTITADVASNILPSADDTYTLGDSSNRWADLYLGPASLHIGTNGNEGIIGYDTSNNWMEFNPSGDGTEEATLSDAGNLTLVGDLAVNGDNITADGDLDIDAAGDDITTPNRLTVGTSTAGVAKLTVTGAETGKALTILNETGNQNILVASNSGTGRFALGANGDASFLNSHGVFGIGSQDSIVHNAGFEVDLDGNGIPDGWTSSGTISRNSSIVNQGSYSLQLGTSGSTQALSRCFPTGATALSAYAVRLHARLNIAPLGLNQLNSRVDGYTTKANCEADSGTNIVSTTSNLSTSWQEIAVSAGFTTTRTWARIKLTSSATTENVLIDSLRVVNSTQTDGLDLAETYPVNPEDDIEMGEIVAFGTGQLEQDVPAIRRSKGTNDQDIFGVVATQPGLVLDDNGDYPKVEVALAGRVPVQVTSENGPIRIGDAITASSVPGIGMRSTKPGRVIGRAMTAWDSNNPSDIGSIIVFVEPGYDSGYILTETKKLIKDAQKAIVADSIKVKELVASSIKATTATIDNLIVNRFTAQEAVITDADIERLNAEALKAQEIEAEKIAAAEAEVEKLTSSDITSGSLSAENAEISGTLVADNIDSQNVRDLRDRLEKLAAEQSDVVIDSETLESEVSEIQEYITQLTNQETPEDIADTAAYQIVDEDIALDPGTTESVLGNTITTANLESLMVTGEASMTTLAVADAFSAGEIFIKDNSLISLNNELKLAALEKIDLMNGGVIITADGTITAKGEVIAQKGVRSNSLRALEDGDDISVILDQREESTFSLTDPSATDTRITNSEFNIQNTSGQKVASIDAEGSARFRDLSLDKYTEATTSAVVIAASDNYKQNGIYTPAIKTNAAASGNGILPEGENDIIVYNDSITKDTVVNLTATSSSRNKALYVDKVESCEDSDKEECTPYFRVALDDDVDIDVTFNWLIVN